MSIKPNDRHKRHKLITEYIGDASKTTQPEIVNHLEKNDLTASQSTVTRDLKMLGYKKIDGEYRKTKDKLKVEQESMLKQLFSHNKPRIISSSKRTHQLIISTKKGMEQSMSDLIYKIYRNKVFGVFTGKGCIMIITDKKNAAIIEEDLNSYIDAV